MKSILPSIQFTMEKEQDNKLSFIDILITHTGHPCIKSQPSPNSTSTLTLTIKSVYPMWKADLKRVKRFVVHMIWGQYSRVDRLFENISFAWSPRPAYNMTKSYLYSIPCSCGNMPPTKSKTCGTSKISMLRWNRKFGNGWPYKDRKGKHLSLWGEVRIIDTKEHWKIRRLKEAVHMLGYRVLLSWPSIEMNMIWEPIIKKRLDKKCDKKRTKW